VPELVTIPLSNFEITIEYQTPKVDLWWDRRNVVQPMFEAFRPWGIEIDDIEALDQGKLSERGLKLRIPRKKASFFFGPAFSRFSQDDANWAMERETIDMIRAGLSTLVATGGIAPSTMHASLTLHLQPRTVRFIDLLRPFTPHRLEGIGEDGDTLRALASVVRFGNRAIYLDGSNSIANAVLVKLDRSFLVGTSFEDVAMQLQADQVAIFNILDVKEDLS